MTRRIVIDPVTRIEGHAKITVQLDDGKVSDARFHVTEFRGFEKFCEGRPFWEMPGITSRVCGICPVSHLLASSKAGDVLLAVTIPPAAALARFKDLLDRYRDESETFGNFPTLFMGLVGPDGSWETYDGRIRFTDSEGRVIADGLDAAHYRDFIGEAVEPDSYLKSPYYLPSGYPEGIYRVGPLARLNVCIRIGTTLADSELEEYRQRGGRTVNSSFWYHYARLIEILAGVENIEHRLDDPDLLSERLRSHAEINILDGVGVSEAPRGTLFHHYRVDESGLIRKVNLIIATGQNNLAMNRAMAQIARHYITGPQISEGVLNRLEAGIRAFDPCLSCSTHALGMMPLHVQLVGPEGDVRDEVWRN